MHSSEQGVLSKCTSLAAFGHDLSTLQVFTMGSFLMSSSVFTVLSILIAVPSSLALVFGEAMHCNLLHVMIPWDLRHGNDGV